MAIHPMRMQKFNNFFYIINKYLIFLLIILAPLTHKELFIFFNPDFNWSKLILVLVAGIGGLVFIKNYRQYLKDPYFITIGGIALIHTVSLMASESPVSTFKMVAFLWVIVLLYSSITFLFKNDKDIPDKIIKVYILGSLILVLFWGGQVYARVFEGSDIGGIWWIKGFTPRFGATFWDVNHFGAYLSAIILLFTAYVFKIINQKNKIIGFSLILYIILLLIMLYFTGSRSAFIGLLSGGSVFAFFITWPGFKNLNTNLKMILSLSGILFIVIFPITILSIKAEELKMMFLYRIQSVFAHLFLYKTGITFGLKNPLTGIGSNAFYEYFKKTPMFETYYFIDPTNYKIPLHNIWLEAFTEAGIIALLSLGLLFFIVIGVLIRIYFKNKDYIALGFAVGLISFCISGLFYSYKAEFFWLLVLFGAVYAVYAANFRFAHRFLGNYRAVIRFILKDISPKEFILAIISITIFIFPLLFIFNPLAKNEISFLINNSNGDIINIYNLFRYVFGNYPFVLRLPSVLFYIGTYLCLFYYFYTISKKNVIKSLMYSSIFIGFSALLIGGILIGIFWPLIFGSMFLLDVAYTLFYIFRKSANNEECVVGVCKFNAMFEKQLFSLLIVTFGLVITGMLLINYQRDYKSQAFLAELAGNKGFYDRAKIIITDDYDKAQMHFYCDTIQSDFSFKGCEFDKINNKTLGVNDLALKYPQNKLILFADNELIQKYKDYYELNPNPKYISKEVYYGDQGFWLIMED